MPKMVGIVHSGTGGGRHDKHITALMNKFKKPIVDTLLLYGNNDPELIKKHVTDLVNENADVIVAAGGTACAEEAKKQTAGKPIKVVFTSVSDSFIPNPDNMTGVYARTAETDATRLCLLHDALPGETTLGVLMASRPHSGDLKGVAAALGLTLDLQTVTGGNTFDAAFKRWKNKKINAAVVTANPFFNDNRADVIKAATNNNIAAIYQWREFADEGGLMSYGTNLTDAYALAGTYVDSILNGKAINELKPVQQTFFELVINQATAKKLRIDIPTKLRARAAVIE